MSRKNDHQDVDDKIAKIITELNAVFV